MRMTHQSALAMKVTTEFDVDHFCFIWHATQHSLFWMLVFWMHICRICQALCLRWSIIAFYYCYTDSHHYYQVKEVWWPWKQSLVISAIIKLEHYSFGSLLCFNHDTEHIVSFKWKFCHRLILGPFRQMLLWDLVANVITKFEWMKSRSWNTIQWQSRISKNNNFWQDLTIALTHQWCLLQLLLL